MHKKESDNKTQVKWIKTTARDANNLHKETKYRQTELQDNKGKNKML